MRFPVAFIAALLAVLGGNHLARAGALPTDDSHWGITVTSFVGSDDYQHQTRTEFEWTGQKFRPRGQFQGRFLGNNDCPHSLVEATDFSLSLMEERRTISAERRAYFRAHGYPQVPEQTVMFELRRWERYISGPMPPLGTPRVLGMTYDNQRGNDWWVHRRMATLWSVSAQLLDVTAPINRVQTKRQPLPLEMDPECAVSLELPPGHFAWEWGRAGQVEPELVEKLGAALVSQAVQEVLLLNGDLNQATVFVHTVHPETRLVFRQRYGFTEVSGTQPKNRKDSILARPLADFLRDERFQPRKFMAGVDSLVALSKGRLDDVQALKILNAARRGMVGFFDFKEEPFPWAPPAIRVEERSPVLNGMLRKVLGEFGVLDLEESIIAALATADFHEQKGIENNPFVSVTPEMFSQPKGSEELAVWASGIPDSFAEQTDAEAKRFLFAIAGGYHRKVESMTHFNPDRVLQSVPWILTTNHSGVAQKLEQIGLKVSISEYIQGFHFDERPGQFVCVPAQRRNGFAAQLSPQLWEALAVSINSADKTDYEALLYASWDRQTQTRYQLRRALTP